MPFKHIALLAGISALFFSVVIAAYLYGSARRSFVSPPKVVSVQTPDQIIQTFESNGVKGRILICFTRYLNAHETKDSKDVKATELAMNHGIVRKVMHITPDAAWPEIRGALLSRNAMRQTPEGFTGIFVDGRVYIMPLSKFPDVAETVLVVVEPKVWSRDELLQITEKLKSSRISSDLILIIRGSEEDAKLFRQAINVRSST